MTDKQIDQQNEFIINKKRNASVGHQRHTPVDLKSRLYDKGFNNSTMPSVKRQFTSKSTDKILTAKLNSQQVRQNRNSQPIYKQQSVVLQKNDQKIQMVQQTIQKKIQKVEADIFHLKEQGFQSQGKSFSARAHTAKMNFQSQSQRYLPAIQESANNQDSIQFDLQQRPNSKINLRIDDEKPSSDRKQLQSAQMISVQSAQMNYLDFNQGFDFHSSIHNPEQIFGRPLSRINSATSIKSKIFPQNQSEIQQKGDEIAPMAELSYTGFGEKEIPKTKFLVDKLSGKFNIDKRYLMGSSKYGKIAEDEIEEEHSRIEEKKYKTGVMRYTRPPTKLDKYVDLILKNVTNVNEFIYLNAPNENDPYDLQVVDYKLIQEQEGQTNQKNEYYTISKKGLCHYVNGKPNDFMQLAYWLKERETYDQIKSLQFFIKFRKWKTLKMWKKNVIMHKNQNCSRALQDKLFYLNPILCKTLLNFRANTYDMMTQLRFIGFDDKENFLNNQEKIFTLEQFKEYQEIIRKKVNSEIQIYSTQCREIVKKGFDDSLEKLKKEQFLLAHEVELGAKDKKKQGQTIFGSKEGAYDALGFPDSLNYEKRSELRKECTKFIKFAYLVDFMAMESLSKIFTYSITELEDRVKILVKNKNDTFISTHKVFNPSEFCPMFQVSIQASLDMDLIPTDQLDIQQIEEFVPIPQGTSKPEDFNIRYHVSLKPPKQQKEIQSNKLLYEDSESEDIIINPEHVYNRVIVPNISDFWLKVHPDKEIFQNDLMKCIAEGINSIQIFERWSRHDDMKKYVRILEEWDDVVGEDKNIHVSNYLNPSEWLEHSPNIIFQQVFQNLIDEAYQKVYVFIKQQFHNFLLLYWENKNINFEIFNSENLINPGDSYYYTFKILNIQKDYFEEQIPYCADLGFLRVDTSDLRSKIVNEPLNILKHFQEFTPPMLQERNNIIRNWLTNQAQLIKANAPNIDEFVKRQNDLRETIHYLPQFRKRFSNLDHIRNIMVEFRFDLSKNLLHQINETTSDLKRLENYIQQAEEQQDKNLEKYVRDVKSKLIPELEKNTHELDSLVQDKKLLTLDINMDQAINQLTELDTQYQILEKKSILFNHYEKTLSLPYTKFEDLEILKLDLSLKLSMWKALKEWQNLTSGWIDSKFTEINVKEIKEKADFYTKIVQKCVKNMPQNAVLDKVKKMVYQFKDTMPVVVALRNKDLKDYHWTEIKKIIGTKFEINEKFTLRNLLDMVKVDTVYDIQDIATQATQEVALKTLYEELNSKWRQLQFTVKDSKEGRSKDAILLSNVDQLYTSLDEMLLNLNNILGSRYLKNLRDDVDILQKKVLNVQETIDDMVSVQKNWLYFENIFKSTEIRQKLKEETSSFDKVDTFFKKQLIYIKKNLFLYKCLGVKSKKDWSVQKEILNTIQLALDQLLEEKRNTFPRLFFLSNDEVLEILAKSGDMESIQKNIKKCFEGVGRLIITEQGVVKNITGMISPEGEKIIFTGKTVSPKGDIEIWLSSFQECMRDILFKNMKKGKQDYEGTNKERLEWVLCHAAQVIGVVATIMWTQYTEHFILQQIEESPTALYDWAGLNHLQLEGLTKLINSGLPDLQHKSIVSLITKDVHGRDIIDSMYSEGVRKITDFIWQKQLRYYWGEDDREMIQIKQVNVTVKYGFEYIGASQRLVITPLTDRAWMTITGALHIQLGASLSGPAGSGKTESLRDLAKGIGMLCVVFNCTKQIEYKLMGKLFSGLSQQGAWACFDEFNKIDVEVLSVIAQQLQTIRAALVKGVDKFIFIDKEIPLKSEGYGVFITMNPGYVGRTELPENLKIQFRPVAMMIPDYSMIAEIMLFSQGFEHAKNLSIKISQLYKLANEQLSQQDHYDFGMRSVKSVLVMAGNLKKAQIDLVEESILIRAMRGCNIPKFLENDIILFSALIKDLFPNTVPMESDFTELSHQIEKSTVRLKFQHVPSFQQKIIQIFETINVRFGVMLVGMTTCGKTTSYQILADTLTQLRNNQSSDQRYQEVQFQVINPKSITVGELYGDVNTVTQEWNDGLGSALLREAASDETDKKQWIVFDGPVDALWVENMNTVLDDNMILCLANGQRIKLRPQMRMLFEIENLKVASPATVSRCGMVFMTCQDLGWRPYVRSWITKKFASQQKKSWDQNQEDESPDPKGMQKEQKQVDILSEELRQYICNLFENSVDRTLQFIRDKLQEIIVTVDLQLVINLCNLLDCFISPEFGFKVNNKVDEQKRFLSHVFAFAFIWSVGITVQDVYHDQLNNLIRDLFQNVIFPNQETVFSYYLDVQNDLIFKNWNDKIIPFQYDKDIPYFNILVHTVDTTRFAFIIQQLILFKKHVYLTGNGGTGKSVMLQAILEDIKEPKMIDSYQLNFSAQTSSIVTQLTIEDKLKKKSKQELGAISGHQIVLFIDDCNMPLIEIYGAQPPIELLRLYIDKGFLWDRKEKFLKKITDTTLLCCSAPPGGGGRSILTQRFTRHFNLLVLPQSRYQTLFQIFKSIILGFFQAYEFQSQILLSTDTVVEITIDLYQRFLEEKLPIPSKFHYTFNVRDLSQVFQGIMMINREQLKDEQSLKRLWVHEVSRVFSDRLVNDEDKSWFNELILELLYKKFKGKAEKEKQFSQLTFIFSDIMKLDQDRDYEEIVDINRLVKLLEDKQEEYNNSGSNAGRMQLVFFDSCIYHILRILRILRQVRGNAMLIGIGGCGKQSLSKLCSYIYNYQIEQIEITKDYDINNFREFIQKNLMYQTGVKCKKITFLYNDNQTVSENFLEDINNMLNSGEVPNLWRPEDKENLLSEIKDINIRNKKPTDPESCQKTFLDNVRNNLHIILCMSPIGNALRIRCRQFSSLIDCCSLNWFESWPESALQSVCCKLLYTNNKFPSYEKINKQELIQNMGYLFKEVHIKSMICANDYYEIFKRKVHITPKSYLDFVNLYQDLLISKREEILSSENRLTIGLTKLAEANKQIAQLQENLNELKPKLEIQNVAVAQALRQVEKDSYMAQQNEGRVSEETDKVAKQKDRIQLIAEEAQMVLDKVMPELIKAQEAVEKIDRGQLVNLRTMNNPPAVVLMVFEAVTALLGQKSDWPTCKSLLMDLNKFIQSLIQYDKDNISPARLKKLNQVLARPEFDINTIAQKVPYVVDLANFCKAMKVYADTFEKILPKKKLAVELQVELDIATVQLQKYLDELSIVQANVHKLREETNRMIKNRDQIEELKELTEARLMRAKKLIDLTENESKRWKVSVKSLNVEVEHLFGDAFMSAACISYNGPFTGQFRKSLNDEWIKLVQKLQIPISENFSIIKILGDPILIRSWCLEGLPSDTVSLENSIYSVKSTKWPLLIDPQLQATKWIKNIENRLLLCLKFQGNWIKDLSGAISIGYPVLIEGVDNMIDSQLDIILLKGFYEQEGSFKIKFGGNVIAYDKNFRLFLTTEKSNPNYLPDIFIKANVINFASTFDGLEEQLLSDVVKTEQPKIESQRDANILNLAQFKQRLSESEVNILRLLAEAIPETILDNVNLIYSLEVSKFTAFEIHDQMKESESLEQKIEEVRESYRSVSTRGAILYFVIKDLYLINPMYQYSQFFVQKLFNQAVSSTPPNNVLHEKQMNLIDQITKSIFTDICEGLFEKDKLIFSFMLAISIEKNKGGISEALWNVFLRGPSVFDKSTQPQIPNKEREWITQSMWDFIHYIDITFDTFRDLTNHIIHKSNLWKEYATSTNPHSQQLPEQWNNISSFEKMIILKIFRPQKLQFAIITYIEFQLGQFYIDPPQFHMDKVLADSNPKTPIIFILSTGADPSHTVIQHARKMKMEENLQLISLGQGQGDKADAIIQQGLQHGHWIYIQNCHLAKTWMNKFQIFLKILRERNEDQIHHNRKDDQRINPNYRIFLTSMPDDEFPPPILTNSIKITMEPPRGIKPNMTRSLQNVTNFFNENCKSEAIKQIFHKLVWGLCYFHAIIQERRKFGSLGWNIIYEFNDSDLDTTTKVMKMLLEEQEQIPWEAMLYVSGHINYGGRITDDWDRRCLISNLKRFYTPDILKQNYQFCNLPIYTIPPFGDISSYKKHLDAFPLSDDPQIFGLNENANIAYQAHESYLILKTIQQTQPKQIEQINGQSNDELAKDIIDNILKLIPNDLAKEKGSKDLFEINDSGLIPSLSTVLLQEMQRMNILLYTIRSTLKSLKLSIEGIIIMTEDLDSCFYSILNNQVPDIWVRVAYPSLKPLGGWIQDLTERVNFLSDWLAKGYQNSYWISGFFFPQGFLTGILQNHSRKYKTPIDQLDFQYKIQDFEKENISIKPTDGAQIHGLFLEGANWDRKKKSVTDTVPGQTFVHMPVIHVSPIINKQMKQEDYCCPVYKISSRVGTLSTTGLSTIFIMTIDLPSLEQPADFWILRGTALLSQINDT